MIDCVAFLERYSDYRDCRQKPAARAAMQAHMAVCEDCRRHDEAIARGVEILRQAEIEPSQDELDIAALRARAREDDGGGDEPWHPGPAAAMAALAAVPLASAVAAAASA